LEGPFRLLRKHRAELATLGALILLAAGAIPLLETALARTTSELKVEAVAALEKAFDRDVGYRSISPSVFLYLEIRDLSLTPRGAESLPAVHVSRVRIYYSLLRLLAGRSALGAVTRVDIRDTSLDMGRIDLSRWGRGAGGAAAQGLAALPASLEVTGTNLSVSVVAGEGAARIERLFFKARRNADQVNVQVTRATVEVGHPRLSFKAQVRFAGRVSPDLETVDAVLAISGFRSETVALSRQAFQIRREQGSLQLRRIRDRAPIDLQLAVDATRATLVVRTDRYNPRTLLSFVGPLAFLNEYTRASITTTSVVEYSFDRGALRYEVDFSALVGGRLLPQDTAVQARLQGDERLMRLDPLLVTSAKGDLRFEGDLLLARLLPEGLLRLSGLTAFADKRLDADLDLRRGERDVVLTGSRFEVGGTAFDGLRLTLTPRPDSLQFELRTAIDHGAPGPRTLTAVGSLRTRPTLSLELYAQARSLPLGLAARLSPLPARTLAAIEPAITDLLVDAGLTLQTDFRKLRLESRQVALTDAVDPRNRATLSVAYNDGQLRVEDLLVAWSGHSAAGSFKMRSSATSAAFDSAIVVDGFPYALEGTWDPSLGLFVNGSYGLSVGLHLLDGSYALSVAARALPLPFRGAEGPPARLDVQLECDWSGPRFWEVRVPRLALSDLGADGSSRLEASFAAGPRLVTVERLIYRDRFGQIANARPGTFALQETLKGSLDLASQSGPERYALTLDLGPRSFVAGLRLQESPLARLAPGALTGNVNGRVLASGPYTSPAVEVSVRLSDARLGEQPLTLSLEAAYRDGRVLVTSLESGMRSYRLGSTSASYEIATGRLLVETSLAGRHAGAPPTSSRIGLSGRIRLGPGMSFRRALFRGELEALATVSEQRGDFPSSWTLAFSRTGDTIRFEGGPAEAIRGRLEEGGAFELSLARPLPVRGRAVGNFMTDDRQTQVEDLEIDLPWLSSFMSGSLGFTRGTAYGVEDITLLGSLDDPLWQGRLEARDVQMSFYMSPELTSPFRADITLLDRDLVLGPTRAAVGPGEVSASGVIGFSHWSPTNYELAIQGGSGGLHTVHDFGAISVDGYASGSIRIKGDDLAVKVTGDLQVDYCQLTLSESPEPRRAEGLERAPVYADIQLTAGRRVEFFWPSATFPVLRASARTGSRLRIEHDGDTQQTRVLGRTALRGGDVFYVNRSFYIKDGELSFNESELRFDPRLTLRGEIRERDRSGEDVRIYLVVDDRRLSEFAPRFESDPPKNEVEIVALLGGPIEEQLVQSGLAGSAVLVSSDIISHFGLLRPFEQGVRDLLRLDLFSIRTQMIQNVVVDRVLGIEPAPAEPKADPLGRYLDNTTVTFGKYIGRELFLEMEVRISERQPTGVDTEVLFSLDWPTPLFDLQWEMSPGGGDMETFVREKTRLSITWRHSY